MITRKRRRACLTVSITLTIPFVLPYIANPANPENPVLGQTVEQIHRQATAEKGKIQQAANSMSQTAGRIGESEVAKITAGRKGLAPLSVVPLQNYSQNTYDPEWEQAAEGARLARLTAKQKAQEYKDWSDAQSRAVDEVAGNLESQLKNTSKGSINLRAEGTGLYVRYYGRPTGPSKFPEPHASVARIRTN